MFSSINIEAISIQEMAFFFIEKRQRFD